MKKILALILALCMVLALVACGNKDAGNTDAGNTDSGATSGDATTGGEDAGASGRP